jgi:signal transduction histidine kinase/DNA-binding response OmpR family regulator
MSSTKISALLVEDNPADVRLIQELLREMEAAPIMELETASSLAEAGLRLARRRADLIFLDLGLPDGVGLETVRRITEMAPEAAVVVLTGLDDEVVAIESLRKGAQDYMVKGRFSSRELVRASRYALERRKVKRDLEYDALWLEALLKLSRMSYQNIDEISNFVLETARRLTRSKVSFLGCVDPEQGRLAIQGWSRSEQDGSEGADLLVDLNKREPWRLAQLSEEPLIVDDIGFKTSGGAGSTRACSPMRQALLAPLQDESLPHGLLGVSGAQEPYSQTDKAHLALLMEGLRTLLRERNQRLELVAARDAAEAANKAKSAFLANMSHEFRTPLNAMLGFTNLALGGELDDRQRRYLNLVLEAGENFLRLQEDLLDISRIEAGKLTLRCEPFDVEKVVRSCMEMFRAVVKSSAVRLKASVLPGTPRRLTGDEGRLRQILINLVGNAVKFTVDGEIELSVEPASTKIGCGRCGLLFKVRDTGCGIAESDWEKVFDSFTQLDDAYSRGHSGAGLGLAISKRLVEMFDGEIWVESKPGRGSTFQFTAMFQPSSEVEPKEEAMLEIPEIEPLRILLVDDDRINEQVTRRILERLGHEVESTNSGRDALDILRGSSFDLAIMDIRMPDLDGFETTRRIRSGLEPNVRSSLPVVALTAYIMRDDEQGYREAGMDGFLSKPLDISKLKRVLAEISGRVRGELIQN